MRIETVKSPGIAHASYYVSDRGHAFVVDPRRDIDDYLRFADEDCAVIDYVFETHRNEDYAIGSKELYEVTEAEILHSKEASFSYGSMIEDGATYNVGRLKMECIWTPGHTIESMCFLVYDTRNGLEPMMIFTGDTLFIGDVGRTDLPGHDIWEKMSGLLWDSLHDKVLNLGNHVIIYPAHTAGSICGSKISDREISTIGYEKKTNELLGLNREEFIENRINNHMPRPPYFLRMEEWNLQGPPLLRDTPKPKLLPPERFHQETQKTNTVILDTRQPDAFAGSHIPGSINIWLEGASYYPGWIIKYHQQILLVNERKTDIETITKYLHRIGYDNITGYLCPGIDAWRNTGKPVHSLPTLSVEQLQQKIATKTIKIIDVREDHEYNEGHIPDSTQIYIGHLQENLDKIPTKTPLCTTCSWGGRASIAASILKTKGYNVSNLLGGMNAWHTKKYPTKKHTQPIK